MGELFVYSAFLGTLFFFFPVFVYLDSYVDARENKCWFALSLFKFFKVFGGYLQIKKEGLVFHITQKKALILPYKQMAPMRKKFEVTKGFQLYRFHQIVETGGEGEPSGVFIGALLMTLGGQIFSAMHTLHPFLSLKNGVLLTETPNLKLSVQAVTVFNGLILSIAIGKKLLEAFLNWIRKKRSTASWKKRHSNSLA